MKRYSVLMCVILCLALLVGAVRAQDQVVIQFVHIFGGDGDTRADVVRAIADDFEALNPGVRIEISSPSVDYIELFNRVLLNASQGNAPHIVQVEEGLTQLAADSGFFVPIESVASDEQLAELDEFLPVVRSYYNIGDITWSVPWNSSNPIVYYNKTITDLLGLQISATEPLTFDEVLEICRRIKAATPIIQAAIPGFQACINWPMTAWMPEQWMAMQDALVVLPDNGRTGRATSVNFTSPAMLRIVEWMKTMADEEYFTYTGAKASFNGEGALFGTGATLLHINSTAGITLFVAGFQNAGVNLGIAPLFVPGEDADNGVTMGGASVWLTAGHNDAETQAATDFIFFLTNAQNDIRWHQGSGYFPNRLSSIEALTTGGLFVDAEGNPTSPLAEGATEVSWFETFPFFRVAVDQLANSAGTLANQGAVIGPSAEVRDVLVEALQSVVDQGVDPAEALAAAQVRADAILAEYNAVVGE